MVCAGVFGFIQWKQLARQSDMSIPKNCQHYFILPGDVEKTIDGLFCAGAFGFMLGVLGLFCFVNK